MSIIERIFKPEVKPEVKAGSGSFEIEIDHDTWMQIITPPIKVMLDEGAFKPEKAHPTDAGFDIRTPKRVYVSPLSSAVVDTGVHVEIPKGYVGMLKSKSGLNTNFGLVGEGVIDSGYTGSIVVKMYNHTSKPYIFETGDKLIQLVIIPIHPANRMVIVDSLGGSDRGDNGFGSTGK